MNQDNKPHRPMFDQDGPAPATAGRRESPQGPPRTVYRAGPAGAPVRSGHSRPQGGAVHTSARTAQRNRARKIKRKRRSVRAATIAVCLIALLVVGIYAGYTTISDHLRGEDTPAGSVPSAARTENFPEYTGQSIINLLVCGIDYDLDEGGNVVADTIGRTDMIMYLTWDTAKNTINIMQLPRDTFVGTELSTGGTGKATDLYFSAQDENERMQPLISVFKDQFQLPVDGYITLDMAAIQAMVDCLGHPLRVYVPTDLVDKKNPNNVLYEGWRDITSAHVEFLLRNRNFPDGDISRLLVQQHFYAAIFRELKTLAPIDMVKWMTILVYYANIGGIDTLQLAGLGQKALSLDSSGITLIRPSITGAARTNHVNGDPVSLVSLVPDEFAELLNTYFRPGGHTVSADQLEIQTLPVVEYIGKSETRITTMDAIEESEGEAPPIE